jgi:hypothetical protein
MKIKWASKHDGYLVPDDEVVEDGHTIHVPLMLCDSMAGRRPGYAQLTDEQVAQRRAPRDRYIRDLNSAWRMDRKPPDDSDDDPDDDPDDDNNDNGRGGARPRRRNSEDAQVAARKAATLAYDQMVKRAENAWRRPVGPVRDNGDPDMSSSAETMPHLRIENADDVQAKRDRIYQDYTTRLSEAWKNPPGVMRPQGALTAAGPTGFINATSSPDPTARAAAIAKQGANWRHGA